MGPMSPILQADSLPSEPPGSNVTLYDFQGYKKSYSSHFHSPRMLFWNPHATKDHSEQSLNINQHQVPEMWGTPAILDLLALKILHEWIQARPTELPNRHIECNKTVNTSFIPEGSEAVCYVTIQQSFVTYSFSYNYHHAPSLKKNLIVSGSN